MTLLLYSHSHVHPLKTQPCVLLAALLMVATWDFGVNFTVFSLTIHDSDWNFATCCLYEDAGH